MPSAAGNASATSAARRFSAIINAGISAGGGDGKAIHIIRPAGVMGRALRRVWQSAMREPHQRAAIALGKINLDQARVRRHFLAGLPTEAVGEAVNRHDFAERAARDTGRVAGRRP